MREEENRRTFFIFLFRATRLPMCTGLGSLSKGVFEPPASTGSEAFILLTCLDDIKFVLLCFFTLIETI